jgi:hypothetical protein
LLSWPKPATTRVVNGVNAAGVHLAAALIRDAVFTRFHVLVARAFSRSRDGDLHARRAFDLLKDPLVRDEVAKLGDAAALKEAEARWQRVCGDHRLEAFLHYRDKVLAHLGKIDPDIRMPMFIDTFELTRLTAGALEKLARAAGIVTLDLESQLPAYRASAREFWAPWIDWREWERDGVDGG